MRIPGLTQTITVRSQSGASVAGDPVYAARRTLAARVQQGRDRTQDAVEHTHVVYTEGELRPDDRVWFPGDNVLDDDAARRPVQINAMRDLTGTIIGWKGLF